MTGSEIYVYNLAKELSKNHTVNVFYRINNRKYKEYEIIEGTYNSVNVYKINSTLERYFSLNDIYNNVYIEDKFCKILDKIKPDIVHIHHLLSLSTGIVSQIKKRGIPVVFTLHDYWLICPKGQLLKPNLTLCEQPFYSNCFYCLEKSLNPNNIIKKLRNFRFKNNFLGRSRNLLEKIFKDIDLFIAPSNFIRNKFIKFGMPEEKIIYSDNGMDLSLFKDIAKSKADIIRFGFIGTIIPSKGLHVLLKAFNRIKNARVVLRIYGKSLMTNWIFNYYHRILRAAGRNKSIKFMGTFDNKDVGRIFKEIDVLIFASLWQENSPLVLHEAILTNTPVIASDIGGVNEFINHHNGVLFKAGDAKDLQKKMEHIIKNPWDTENLKNNMPKVKSIKDNAEELEVIYNRLLKSKKGLVK